MLKEWNCCRIPIFNVQRNYFKVKYVDSEIPFLCPVFLLHTWSTLTPVDRRRRSSPH